MDNFTETSSESWGGRIMGAIGGIFFGILLVLFAVCLLFWNEGRSVKKAQSLREGAKSVKVATVETVNPDFERKMVYVSGDVKTPDTLTDPLFGVSANAIRLVREVSMYQWAQEKKTEKTDNTGGSSTTTTTYTYKKEWSKTLIDSSNFKHPEGHTNPAEMPVRGFSDTAGRVTLGAFVLPSSVISRMGGEQPLAVDTGALDKVSAPYRQRMQLDDGGFHLGKDPANPEVGDQKIRFQVLPTGPFSIVAEQVGKTFEPYTTKNGEELVLVESGNVTVDLMFHHAESENKAITWGVRGGGVVIMFFGILLILNPIVVLADVLPILGDIASFGVSLTALTLSVTMSLTVIAVAWIAYRPLLGIALFVVVAAGIVWLIMSVHGSGKARVTR